MKKEDLEYDGWHLEEDCTCSNLHKGINCKEHHELEILMPTQSLNNKEAVIDGKTYKLTLVE